MSDSHMIIAGDNDFDDAVEETRPLDADVTQEILTDELVRCRALVAMLPPAECLVMDNRRVVLGCELGTYDVPRDDWRQLATDLARLIEPPDADDVAILVKRLPTEIWNLLEPFRAGDSQ